MTLVLDSATALTVCGLVRDGREHRVRDAPRAAARRSARSRSSTTCSRARAARAAISRRSSSAAARGRSPACASASRPRAASPSGSACRASASRRWPRSPPARPGRVALIDARRSELFALDDGRQRRSSSSPPSVAARLAPGTLCVGDGARRYRALLEAAGAVVPPDGDAASRARRRGARAPGRRRAPEPIYVRRPDAEPRVA